jgi:hypothetical protein
MQYPCRRPPHSISFGGFRTPAARACGTARERPASETLHRSGHSGKTSNPPPQIGIRRHIPVRPDEARTASSDGSLIYVKGPKGETCRRANRSARISFSFGIGATPLVAARLLATLATCGRIVSSVEQHRPILGLSPARSPRTATSPKSRGVNATANAFLHDQDPKPTLIGLSSAVAPQQLSPPNLLPFKMTVARLPLGSEFSGIAAYGADFVLPTNFTILQSCLLS